jgi:hypothetical protein
MRERGNVSVSVNWRRCNYFVCLFTIKILKLYVFSYGMKRVKRKYERKRKRGCGCELS